MLAGVSEISVSRVMRNAPNISDLLRKGDGGRRYAQLHAKQNGRGA